MPKVIITIGIPASGKTTWSKEYVKSNPTTVIVCRDDIRLEHGLKFGENEEAVNRFHRSKIAAAIHYGHDVVVADTNIHLPHRRSLISFAHYHNADVELKLFPIELEEALRRDKLRTASVGESVVTRFYERWMSMDPILQTHIPVPNCC